MLPQTIPFALALMLCAATGLAVMLAERRAAKRQVSIVYDAWQAADQKRQDKEREEIANRDWQSVTRDPVKESAMKAVTPKRELTCFLAVDQATRNPESRSAFLD